MAVMSRIWSEMDEADKEVVQVIVELNCKGGPFVAKTIALRARCFG